MNTPTSLTLRDKLETLKQERATLEFLPSKQPLEAAVQRLVAQHALHPTKYREALETAMRELEELEEQITRRAELNTDISSTQVELDLEVGQIRADRMADIDKRYAEIANEYKHNCLQAAQSHRKLLDYCRSNGLTLPPRFDSFNVPFLMGFGWQGTLGEAMSQGPLPFEAPDRNEKEAA